MLPNDKDEEKRDSREPEPGDKKYDEIKMIKDEMARRRSVRVIIRENA